MILRKHTFITLALASAMQCAWALDVNVSAPGTLEQALGGQTDVSSLKVTGTIDASDFHFINNTLTSLTTLDLSGAQIAAYEGPKVLLGRTTSPAATVPECALAALKLTSVSLPADVTAIGEGAFASSALTSVDLSAASQLREIGAGAFSGCKALVNVVIPDGVTLGSNVLSGCTALKSVKMGTPAIPASAFSGCSALQTLTLTVSPVSVGERAFYGCSSLQAFPFGSALTTIGAGAFEGSGLTAADLSGCAGLKAVGDWAFASCPALASVHLGENVNTLGRGLFFEDKALVTVAVPVAVTELPDYLFKGDDAINTEALLHASIVKIGDYALMDLSQVTDFTLPNELRELGDGAMAGWSALRTLHFEGADMVPELGEDVWEGVDQPAVELYVPEALAGGFYTTAQWKEFNVMGVTGSEGITADTFAERVKAWFEGTDLRIEADSRIDAVGVYDLDGRTVVAVSPGENAITISTADMQMRVYLVRLVLEDGTVATFKLAR